MAKNRAVYRPTLTEEQLKYIVGAAKVEIGSGKMNEINLSIVSVLSPFIAKIENNGLVAAYSRNTETVEESIGMGPSIATIATNRREQIGIQFVNGTRTMGSMSIQELELLAEYRYENDMMNTEEEEAYVAKLLGL